VINNAILEVISKNLSRLSWRCEGCPQISVCQSQDNGGEPRYCWPVIEAAILGVDSWKTAHRKEEEATP